MQGRVERARGVVERPEGAECLGHLAYRRREALALGGARPGDPEARGLDAGLLERADEHRVARGGAEVPVEVVAVAGVAARDEHAVRALAERLEHEGRLDAPGAHDADGEEALRVLEPRLPGAVRGGVGAPAAEEGDDAGLVGHRAILRPPACAAAP